MQDTLDLEKFVELRGVEDGPTSVILAGVHGDERGGIEALKELLPDLTIQKGRVFLGYGNPRAIVENKRFTEANLNRMFKDDSLLSLEERGSYEYARAQVIKTYLDEASALLDLHASYVPDSPPFIICEPNAQEIVEHLPTDTVVAGFDAVQPGGTDYYMNAKGGAGICVECGYLSDKDSVGVAKDAILRFLAARGHISGNFISIDKTYFSIYEMYVTKSSEFKLAKKFRDFDTLPPGTLIGLDGSMEISAPKESMILFARDCNGAGQEAFLLGEQKSSLA